jgi:integrase
MPRAPKLGKVNGYWCTKAGDQSGVYFGKVGEVPFKEANRAFRKYLATLSADRKQIKLPQLSVAEICDAHLAWVKSDRSPSLFRQRCSILNYWCKHEVEPYNGGRLPGHGKQIGRLRATVITRPHVEQHIQQRATNPSAHTGRPLGDKGQRAIVVAIKACWNWAANTIEDGGGGLLPEDLRPLAKLSRGYVAPKDLTESNLPTDEEIQFLFLWAVVEPTMVRAPHGRWRERRPDEIYTHDSQVFADMLQVYHATGSRTSELCDALVRDFMPRTQQICLGSHKRARTQHNPTLRNMQLSNETCEILVRNTRGKQVTDPLFTREDGKPWDHGGVNSRLKRVIGLAVRHDQPVRNHITPYTFRDLYISELLMIGTPPFQVAKMAGTSMKEIERSYGHFFNQDLATAQARLQVERDRRFKEVIQECKKVTG